jgi:hypothetical protein
MFPETKRTKESDCPVCYASHDEEIHEATNAAARLVSPTHDTPLAARRVLRNGKAGPRSLVRRLSREAPLPYSRAYVFGTNVDRKRSRDRKGAEGV